MEINEFHWTDGWYFKLNDDDSVRVRKTVAMQTVEGQTAYAIIAEANIPAIEWKSIEDHFARVRAANRGPLHYPPGMGEESRRLHREYNRLVAEQNAGARNGAEVVKLTDECAAKGIILVPGGENL